MYWNADILTDQLTARSSVGLTQSTNPSVHKYDSIGQFSWLNLAVELTVKRDGKGHAPSQSANTGAYTFSPIRKKIGKLAPWTATLHALLLQNDGLLTPFMKIHQRKADCLVVDANSMVRTLCSLLQFEDIESKSSFHHLLLSLRF